jgi:aryl-alcohol dehydrogenase-like predicted oxidoreductase
METNKLILGTVQFGLKYGINNVSERPDQTGVNEMLLFAFNAGIKCLDTAEVYGNAHQAIGKFHESNSAILFDIITKLPDQLDHQLGIKVDQYIKDLNVKKLKLLLFHSFNTYVQNKGAVMEMAILKEHNKIEQTGVSVYSNEQARVAIDDNGIDVIQIPFNLFDNNNHRGEILIEAKKRGKIVHTRSTFLQGLFFTDLKKNNTKIVNSLRKEISKIQSTDLIKNLSVQEIALNYCLQQSYIDQILIGVDNIHQLKENLKHAQYLISEDIISKINEINISNKNLLNPSLWNQ